MKLLLSGNSGQIAQTGNFNGISTRLEEQLKILNPKCTNLDVSVFSPRLKSAMLLLEEREVISLTHLRPPTPIWPTGKKHLASGHSIGHHFLFSDAISGQISKMWRNMSFRLDFAVFRQFSRIPFCWNFALIWHCFITSYIWPDI